VGVILVDPTKESETREQTKKIREQYLRTKKKPNYFCDECGYEFHAEKQPSTCPNPSCEAKGRIHPLLAKPKGAGIEFTRDGKATSMRIHQPTRDLIFELGSMHDDMEDVVLRALRLLKEQREKHRE